MTPLRPTVRLVPWLLLALAGCASTPSTTSGSSLDAAIAAYESGRYAESLGDAERVANARIDATSRDEASYLAGMSAYRLGRDTEARRWLAAASTGSDPWLAGQALITLGSVELRQGNPREAARNFVRAAERLPDADESARARTAAGWAYRQANDDANARAQFALATVSSSGPGPAPARGSALPEGSTPTLSDAARRSGDTTPPASAAGAFAIQAGAFRERARAESRATELAAKARELGLGSARIAAKPTAAGASVWVVQFGSFADRPSAERMKAKLGGANLSVERSLAGG